MRRSGFLQADIVLRVVSRVLVFGSSFYMFSAKSFVASK